ncbi:hypothetical protein IAG44_36385 [Streptomyces roseirectus]|uniref:Integral membrane protein n=1 Tax=Streptomyces roseirectus TaxID=2768066 RepID=A0A7H0INN7_9ACTN|nr:DUF6328 family protein [Streptomyces roseirectus]QNP74403.1 hypothetical protein IAG44_36385 [Streptomyces roseirectus]
MDSETKDVTNDWGRRETPEERADRRWNDLLQEVRVALTGVQVLFAFLLAVVFQPRFADVSDTDRALYVVTVVLAAGSTGALIGPVALHRILTGRRVKPQTVDWAARLTVIGLFLLLGTMTTALLLVLRAVTDDTLAAWLTVPVVGWLAVCWLLLPLWARVRTNGNGRQARP